MPCKFLFRKTSIHVRCCIMIIFYYISTCTYSRVIAIFHFILICIHQSVLSFSYIVTITYKRLIICRYTCPLYLSKESKLSNAFPVPKATHETVSCAIITFIPVFSCNSLSNPSIKQPPPVM